jgi:hypothetical protein
MSEYVGLALAAAGHDRGTLYLVLGEEGDRVLLADGKLRKLSRPKRKNRKHVIFLPDGLTEAVCGKLSRPLTDAALRRALAAARAWQAN